MELHFGVIRNKQAIHAVLEESRANDRHLAVCFNSEGKLIVKICTVVDILDDNVATRVILRSQSGDGDSDFSLLLSNIQSIYPIRDFKVEESSSSEELDWPDDPEPNG